MAIENCPVCGGAADVEEEPAMIGTVKTYKHTMSIAHIALALDHEPTALALAHVMPAGLRLVLAGVLIGKITPEDQPFFTEQDVLDEAEARARCVGVVKQLRDRNKLQEAIEFSGLAERHGRRALRILSLLDDETQARMAQQIHGPMLGGTGLVEVVKS